MAFFALIASGFAADMSYVATTIAAESKDETMISDAYDTFLALISDHEIKAGELKYPARIADHRDNGVIIERTYYVSPNEMRGFSLFIPKDCVTEKGEILISTAALVIESEETRQGVRCLMLKKKN